MAAVTFLNTLISTDTEILESMIFLSNFTELHTCSGTWKEINDEEVARDYR